MGLFVLKDLTCPGEENIEEREKEQSFILIPDLKQKMHQLFNRFLFTR